jgi:hypothetical protein
MLNIPGYLRSKMTWHLVVIQVRSRSAVKRDGVGKGTNRNAASVKSGGVGMAGKTLV